MKTISIRELHTHTGLHVRAASREPIVVTDRGETVAVLQPPKMVHLPGRPFPKRNRSAMPVVQTDSGKLISEDRDR